MKKAIIRLFLVLLSVALVILYIGPVVTVHEINIGILTGFSVAFLLLIYSIFFNKINTLIKSITNKKSGKIVTSIISIILCIGITTSGVAFGNILANTKPDKQKTEVVVVLGCIVNGTRPGPFLRSRINKAYEYLNENPNSIAILSGGQGTGESISESQCIYDNLVEKGIDANRLLIEDKSTSTLENFQNTAKILEENKINDKNITIITNEFHEYRASQFAKRCGFTPYQCPSKTPWIGFMPFATREIYAIFYQIYLNR